MKVVVAVDSFKGSMTSMEAGMAVKAGILAAKIIGFATCPFISFMLSYFILICLKVAFFGFDICSAFLIILPYPNAASHFVKIPNKKILPITYRKYFSLIIFGALL